LNIFSLTRKPQWSFNLDIFVDDIEFTMGFFEPKLSIFSEASNNKRDGHNYNELSSFNSINNDIYEDEINQNDNLQVNLSKKFNTFNFDQLNFLKEERIFDTSKEINGNINSAYISSISSI
jgi:hypothetical protein